VRNNTKVPDPLWRELSHVDLDLFGLVRGQFWAQPGERTGERAAREGEGRWEGGGGGTGSMGQEGDAGESPLGDHGFEGGRGKLRREG